jgi:hypothetical protein
MTLWHPWKARFSFNVAQQSIIEVEAICAEHPEQEPRISLEPGGTM